MKTQEELNALKASWIKDPCWDIEDTPGFEEHEAELLEYRKQTEAAAELKIKQQQQERAKLIGQDLGLIDFKLAQSLFTFSEIESELKLLDNQIGDGGSANGWAHFVIAREQVRATLLLATQVKRVADLLEQKIEEDLASETRDFNTKLYKME